MGHLDPKWDEANAPWPPGKAIRLVDAPGGLAHRWQLRPGAFLHEAAPSLYHRWWRRLTGNLGGYRQSACALSN